MLGPFDPSVIAAGILTNFAYDVLKSKTQASKNTLVGRMLQRAGLKEDDFDDRLRDILTRALAVYFKEHPEYAISGIEEFFSDPAVTQQIGDYILDRHLIDEQRLQQAFVQHLQDTNVASKILIQRKGLTSKHIIEDFLQCYRRVLSEQLSVPEMGILLDVLDLNTTTIQEIKASEERLKEYITTLVNTRLSPASLRAVYQAEQQQVTTSTVNLVQASQASRQAQPLPHLFTSGLCKGHPLHPAGDRYFVSHGFDPKKLADWRQVIAEALSHINHAAQPLQPYFSGDRILGGFRLCTICEQLYSTNFSLFLLPSTQNRNVYLELGIAIGLGRPFLLIREYGAPIPPILTSLSLYTQGGSFRTMRRELAGQIEEYDFGAVLFTKDTGNLLMLSQYLIAAGETIEDEDFEGSLSDALNMAYPQQLTTLSLSAHLNRTKGLGLQHLVELIQASRFAVYRIDEQCSPTTFLALGMSIGLNRPFLMMSREGNEVPLDLRGLGIYQFSNFTDLENEVVKWHRAFFDDVM